MSRAKIEQSLQEARREAERLGAELLTGEDAFIDDEHLDCVWYGGYVGGLRYKGYELSIEVHGDVMMEGSVNGEWIQYKNTQNTGATSMSASDSLRTAFRSDRELQNARSKEQIYFTENSWVEVFVKLPSGEWDGNSIVDDADDVLDACCGVSEWIDWLEANYIKEERV